MTTYAQAVPVGCAVRTRSPIGVEQTFFAPRVLTILNLTPRPIDTPTDNHSTGCRMRNSFLTELAPCGAVRPRAMVCELEVSPLRSARPAMYRTHLISILRKSQKPGFSLYFSSPNPKLQEYPVSRPLRKSQKPVSLYISRHPTQKLKDVKWVL
ncbi:MAG: hypothetical protein WBA89_25575 [Microcoleus sp.]|uniref:hypothetical protein n=1 Tax=Microcoleus sp. TaxID=44472 RepID=UPI003C707A0F